MAKLSIVGTPIGNLDDITIRALRVLGEADIILCEDTRMTKRLLARHAISAATKSYHAHSTEARTGEIVSLLRSGKNLALVSDAGTPGISDPGTELVSLIRRECAPEILSGEIVIEGVPGPSALTTAISIAGMPCADFLFLGFLPHKKGRETLFREIAASSRTTVFYESPHRIDKTLSSLGEHIGPDREIAVCRELTKIYEEVIRGTPEAVAAALSAKPEKKRGEFVVIVSGAL